MADRPSISPGAIDPEDRDRPSRLDRLGLAALAVLALVVAATAWLASGGTPPAVDRAVTGWAVARRDALPAATAALRAATRLGNPDVAAAAILLIVGVWYLLHRLRLVPMLRGDALFFAGVVLVARFANPALKGLIDRERPPEAIRLVAETTPSFPSGHAQFAGVLFGLSVLAIRHAFRDAPGWYRAALIGAMLALCLAIAWSRVWLGVHYLTDVVGGASMGLALVIAARLIRGTIRRRLTAAEVAR